MNDVSLNILIVLILANMEGPFFNIFETHMCSTYSDTIPPVAEGGTTDNGMGDPTDMSTVGLFCTNAVPNNPAVNNGAGYGGPTRVRVRGQNVPNFTSIP